MNLFSLENASYYSKKKERLLLDNLKATFPADKISFIFGNNSQEKSLLTALLGGLDLFNTGSLRYQGENLTAETLANYRKDQVAIYLTDYLGLSKQSLVKNLLIYRQVVEKNFDKVSCYEYLAKFGITKEQANQSFQKQESLVLKRYALARLLVRKPQIIVANDLLDDLPEDLQADFIDYLHEEMKQRQLTIIITSSHQQLAKYADEYWGLNHGKLVFIGEKTNVFQKL
ncbi:putative ABC transport system ATP-binding protein [Enterococcus sp. PF1-24]|uniref:ATP-binding cassette domain-containing protein n=1 Tax=unclassified Enterococcus TaxID=2608891 RepID=UPI0024741239|nr:MULTISPECIES: ATP-binding cassette domain-containing protein [unclassified Enterococcus]MDH6363142.1 putative ABC transport system ATP-binding protein [Enterococcus sp. PFB1-1]MDH6400236.1 putative ABC transport system ATP-binding protein [Enterococcus sp. PF1-24]